MLPLLPFVAGLAAGVVAIKLYRNEAVRTELQKVGKTLRKSGASTEKKLRETSAEAQEKLRKAALSGLSGIETSSAKLREKLGEKRATAKRAAAKPARKTAATRTAKPAKTKAPARKTTRAAPKPKAATPTTRT